MVSLESAGAIPVITGATLDLTFNICSSCSYRMLTRHLHKCDAGAGCEKESIVCHLRLFPRQQLLKCTYGMSICVNINVLSFWMRHLAALPCRDHGGGLKAFARGGRGEISLNDSSIRDLTCALIISWAPLQISLSNKRQIWQAPALLLTIPTPLTLPPLHHHCRHYTYPS